MLSKLSNTSGDVVEPSVNPGDGEVRMFNVEVKVLVVVGVSPAFFHLTDVDNFHCLVERNGIFPGGKDSVAGTALPDSIGNVNLVTGASRASLTISNLNATVQLFLADTPVPVTVIRTNFVPTSVLSFNPSCFTHLFLLCSDSRCLRTSERSSPI